MTEQIVGDKFTVVNLAGASDVHDYDLTPQDRVKIKNAALLIYQGAQLEPWAEDVIPSVKTPILEVTHDLLLAKAESHDDHNEEEKHTDEKHEEEDHAEHHHGQFDPHPWLDPVLAQAMVDEILAAVIKINADNQALFTQNANQLKQQFATLDQAFAGTLNNCENREVIVSHDAFGYLAHRYNFKTHAIAGLSTQDEPSAKTLAKLKAEAEAGITHILVEENNVRQFADTLARETNLQVLPLNPLGQGTLDSNLDFFDVMQQNLNSFKTALNCKA